MVAQSIIIWGGLALVSAIAAGLLAGWKNRDYSFWMAWGFIIPVLPPLLLLIMPRHQGPRPKRPSLDDDDRHLY
ncbi:MAG: hypothetical protein K0U34_02300 [Alphaproteobacteria bacterium]|nr:hypothetical protein [Alphaproteobacteria bacterium]